jgi:hypothetical protein
MSGMAETISMQVNGFSVKVKVSNTIMQEVDE